MGVQESTRSDAQSSTELLELLTHETGLDLDRRRLTEVATSASRSHGGTVDDGWEEWLKQSAEDVGLIVRSAPLSAKSAIAQTASGSPLLTVQGNQWFVLSSRSGGKAKLTSSDGSSLWVNAKELARRVGSNDPGEPLTWAQVFPASIAKGEHGHGGHDGHGHHGHHMSPMRRLLHLMAPETKDIIAVVIFAIGIGILSLIVPLAAEELVATVGRGVLYQPIIVMSLMLAACLGLAAALRAMQTWIVELLQQRLFVRVVADLAYRLPRVEQEAFDGQHGPELVNRFFDVLTMQKTLSILLLDGVALVISAVVGLIILSFYDFVLLGTFAAVIGVAVLFILFGLGRGALRTSIEESVAKYNVAFWLQELVQRPRAFKESGGTDLAWSEADRLARDYIIRRRSHFRIVFRQVVSMLFLQVIAGTALLGIGGFLVIERRITLGQLVAAELIVTVVLTSVAKFGKSLDSFYDLLTAVDKLGHLIELPLENSSGEALPDSPRGATLSLLDVGFSYPNGRKVLDNITATIKSGERVALIGGSGYGKTTLVNILTGQRNPTEGRVEIDGVDLRELRVDSVREQIAIVREGQIFNGTVMDNVLLGRTQYGPADVRRVLSQVGLLDDLLAMPDGLKTFLVTGGKGLSFGQALRLELARALLGRPRLLVLDETLDSFDISTRLQMMSALFARDASWTLLLITRRPDLLEECDRTLMLERSEPNAPATLVPATAAGRMLAGSVMTEDLGV